MSSSRNTRETLCDGKGLGAHVSVPLRLFTGNRLEILADQLAEVLETPLSSPLDEEIILVQSKGMERWVSMALARCHGICANYAFPFPNTFVYDMFRTVLRDLPERSPFEPEVMTWKIMKLLPALVSRPGFGDLKAYLKERGGNLRRFQLSERIAHTFDQYLLFRPDMILRWEAEREDHWQAVLWRALSKGKERSHRPALAKAFFRVLEKTPSEAAGLPERVSVFGISTLPRFHMEILSAIGRFTEVNLFLMNPCKEYWGNVVSDWQIKKTLEREGSGDLGAEDLHLERGNSLLASMGRLGRDFFDATSDLDCRENSSFEEPGEDSLLSAIQSDILHLRDRGGEDSPEKQVVDEKDSSVQVHSCHSPMREMEVLHDRLLEMFERDASLLPKDVLVMTPDIETYAPYVRAVFDVQAEEAKEFPYTIADQSVRRESDLVDTFLGILDLHGSRFGASEVLTLLESKAVQRRFDLSEGDLETLRTWVRETRIRWGIDEGDRAAMGLPAFAENTWKAGLDRLLLGYTMAGNGESPFEGVLPYDHVEGSETTLLGRFLAFVHELFDQVGALGMDTLDGWSERLARLLERFFCPLEDEESEMQLVRRKLKELGEMSLETRAGFDEAMDLPVIRWHLGRLLEREGPGLGFMAGGITFCAMLPMRSIPFKVICLVGLNGSAYPRQSKPLGFDLMAARPRPGDRSPRNDDRYLFLESLLSARERLYISYVGQNIQDNGAVPPSVLVSELLDYIEQGFMLKGGRILDCVVTEHRLQAFSPAYFKRNGKLFSYSEENCKAAQYVLKDRQAPLSFVSKGLPVPEEAWKKVNLHDLCRFFSNPAKFLINRRLGVYLEERSFLLEEKETFELKGLEKYLLEEDLVEKRLSGWQLKDVAAAVKATGILPHGTVGECLLERLSRGVDRFVEKTGPYLAAPAIGPKEVELSLWGFEITGTFPAVFPERLVQHRYAKIKAKDRLNLWIYHLVLNALGDDVCPRTSMLAGLSRSEEWSAWEYLPVEESEEVLKRLLEAYWRGLTRPLHFFPESSWVYAERLLRKKGAGDHALRGARDTWAGSYFKRGEGEDLYYRLCFRGTEPLDEEFRHTAQEVFGPLLKCQKEIR